MADAYHYVPILRSRKGEIDALARSTDVVKSRMTPLIEVTKWNTASRKGQAKTNESHLEEVTENLAQAWKAARPIFVDVAGLVIDYALDGADLVRTMAQRARDADLPAVPVDGLERGQQYHDEVANIHRTDERGICLRLTPISYGDPLTVERRLRRLLDHWDVEVGEVHVILDIANGPLAQARLLLSMLPWEEDWRGVTIAAGTFPQSLTSLRGLGRFERQEWRLWDALHDSAGDDVEDEEDQPVTDEHPASVITASTDPCERTSPSEGHRTCAIRPLATGSLYAATRKAALVKSLTYADRLRRFRSSGVAATAGATPGFSTMGRASTSKPGTTRRG